MDIFKEIKERVDIVDVCKVLKIELNRSYKSLCPLPNHKEKTPSFSISRSKNMFYCFGCGVGGDSITLVQKILGISALESAKYLNDILGIGLDLKTSTSKYEINKYTQKRKTEEAFKKWEKETFILITDYLNILYEYLKIGNPKNALYINALHEIEYTKYIVDLFLEGTNEDKLWFWKNEKRFINKIKNKISTLKIK